MKIEIELKEKAAVVKIAGDLDYNSYNGFNEKINGLLDDDLSPIVIDMGSVGHIDSMGLGTITKLWKAADKKGSLFVLAAVPENVNKLLKLINLDNRIRIFDNVDSALS